MSGVVAIKCGLLSASVCAPAELTGEQAAAEFGASRPAGTENGWQLSADKTFADGKPQGCPCDMFGPHRRHWLLDA